jgi:hypothetical protein
MLLLFLFYYSLNEINNPLMPVLTSNNEKKIKERKKRKERKRKEKKRKEKKRKKKKEE